LVSPGSGKRVKIIIPRGEDGPFMGSVYNQPDPFIKS
jgi:hypothetical protein